MSLLSPYLHKVFAPAELCALVLDGEAFPVGMGYMPSDHPESWVDRAHITQEGLPDHVVPCLWSAAWILGCVDSVPDRRYVCSLTGLRTTFAHDLRVTVVQATLSPSDVYGDMEARVTRPARTALDMARFVAQDSEALTQTLARLIQLDPESARQAVSKLEKGAHIPHKRRAEARLRPLVELALSDAVDVVDRVNTTHGVEHAIKMRSVTHLKDELAQRQALGGGGDRGGENVHVVLREHPGHIRQQSRAVQRLNLNLHQEDALR
jgi:hypothetical protein